MTSSKNTTPDTKTTDQPFDEVVSPLLDAALKAPPVPVDLANRIFMATRQQLQTTTDHWTTRLGPIWLRRLNALAAGIVLAGSVGILIAASGILRDAHEVVTVKEDLALLGQYEGRNAQIDQDIRQLTKHIDAASTYSYTDSEAARMVSALETLATTTGSTASPTSAEDYNNLF